MAPSRSTRHRVLHDVRQHAPTTVAETARRLQVSPKTVYHHARRLVRQGYVRERTLGRRRYLLSARMRPGWEREAVLADPALAELYDVVAGNPGIPQGAVVSLLSRTGWKRSTVQYRLGRLVEAGLVLRRGTRGRHLHPAPPTGSAGTIDAPAGADLPRPPP